MSESDTQTLYSYEICSFLLQFEHLKVFMLFISGEMLHKIIVIFLAVENLLLLLSAVYKVLVSRFS